MSKPVHELATIIGQYKTSFVQKHQPLKHHLSVLNALENAALHHWWSCGYL